jgi:lipoyl(octanoyl) transferase
LWSVDLGVVPFQDAWTLQQRVRSARQAGAIPDTFLLLEHPPVYTRGRRSDPAELPLGEAWYAAQGIEIVDVNRGGKVTYHGPGQLVGYPIAAVGTLMEFVGELEMAIVAALRDEGLDAHGRSHEGPEFTGVWVQDRKIASIGLHRSRGVTAHGVAVNVNNDLRPFEWIVPCGLGGVQMTSIARERGADADIGCFRKRLAHRLAEGRGQRQRLIPPARLQRELEAVPVV